VLHLVEVLDVDRIGTFAAADVALGARGLVADDVQQREDFAPQVDHLPEVAREAGDAQSPYPGRSHAQQPEHPQQDDDAHEGDGEFEDVAQRAQRADVFAPEHFDEKAAEEEHRNRDDGHPDGDLALEARGDGVVGVEILAEKLAARRRHVEYVEQQGVFDGAEQAVGDASRAYFNADLQLLAAPAHPFADGSQRAEVAAEEFAEKDHSHGEHDAHHDLRHGHRAGQRVVDQVASQRLQSAERAVGLHVRGFLPERKPVDHESHDCRKRAPLQQIL